MRVLVNFEYETDADDVWTVKEELAEEYFSTFGEKIQNLEIEEID